MLPPGSNAVEPKDPPLLFVDGVPVLPVIEVMVSLTSITFLTLLAFGGGVFSFEDSDSAAFTTPVFGSPGSDGFKVCWEGC